MENANFSREKLFLRQLPELLQHRFIITSYDNIYFIITKDNDDIRYFNILLLLDWKRYSENITKDVLKNL